MINRVTKKPGVDKTEVTGTIGSWNQKRGEFDIGRNLNEEHTMAFRVTGAVERSDSYRDQQFLERETIAPSMLFKLAPATTLLLQADYLRDKRLTDFGVPSYQGRPVPVPPGTYYGAANAGAVDTSESTVDSVGFTFDHKFNDKLAFHNAFRRYQYTLIRNNTLVGATNEVAQTARLDHSNVWRSEDGYFNQSELTQKLKLAGMDHQLLYGVEIGKQNKDQYFVTQTGVGTVNLFNPVLPVVNLIGNAAPSTNNTGILKNTSAYVQDLLTITQQWKALAGLRFDRFEQETQNRLPGTTNLSRTDNTWSPRAGVVYQPRLDQSYYASVSKSFQPSGETFPLAANNAQIAPEETTNYEVGAKLDYFEGNASLNAALFNLQRTNMKFTDPVTNTLVPVGTQRTRGLELSFTGQLPGNWNIWSGYAYMDSEVTSSPAVDAGQPVQGKQATLTPRNSGSVWLTKNLLDGWRAGGGVTYVGDRFANPGNTVVLPAYAKLDAMVGYRIKKLDLQLNLNNLLNKGYIVSGHGTSPNLNLPGAPRNAQLIARYNF
jgi:catecholate siderophore receptor